MLEGSQQSFLPLALTALRALVKLGPVEPDDTAGLEAILPAYLSDASAPDDEWAAAIDDLVAVQRSQVLTSVSLPDGAKQRLSRLSKVSTGLIPEDRTLGWMELVYIRAARDAGVLGRTDSALAATACSRANSAWLGGDSESAYYFALWASSDPSYCPALMGNRDEWSRALRQGAAGQNISDSILAFFGPALADGADLERTALVRLRDIDSGIRDRGTDVPVRGPEILTRVIRGSLSDPYRYPALRARLLRDVVFVGAIAGTAQSSDWDVVMGVGVEQLAGVGGSLAGAPLASPLGSADTSSTLLLRLALTSPQTKPNLPDPADSAWIVPTASGLRSAAAIRLDDCRYAPVDAAQLQQETATVQGHVLSWGQVVGFSLDVRAAEDCLDTAGDHRNDIEALKQALREYDSFAIDSTLQAALPEPVQSIHMTATWAAVESSCLLDSKLDGDTATKAGSIVDAYLAQFAGSKAYETYSAAAFYAALRTDSLVRVGCTPGWWAGFPAGSTTPPR